MTIEVGTQKVGRIGRRGGKRPATSLPIGEIDANIFACPACNRPLGSGTSRCPSCNTLLIGGVKASRAAIFVGIGLFSGMIVSGALMGIATVAGVRSAAVPIVEAPPIVTPSQAPAAERRCAGRRSRHPERCDLRAAPIDPRQPARRGRR